MRKALLLVLIFVSSCASSRAASQRAGAAATPPATGASSNQITVRFSDASRPGLLRVHLLSSPISIRAYSGNEVIIDAEPRGPQVEPIAAGTLRRIDSGLGGIEVDEQANLIDIRSSVPNRRVRVNIQVPAKTNLDLSGINGGTIEVEGVDGDITIENTNGGVRANNVSGSIRAESLNGGVFVTMRNVTPGKSMSLSTMNGPVDLTLPPTVKASAKMQTRHGGIWTDFDIQQLASSGVDNDYHGTINGGGPDLTLSTMNGNIFIRKGK
jgi:hypothetical protein